MAETFPGAELAKTFQLEHESKMTRATRPTAASDQLRDRLFIEKHVQLHRQGWEKATVVNLHTFPLEVNLGYLGHMYVPARKPGEPYAKFVIDKYKLDARDLGDARFIPEPVMPIELASEFLREYAPDITGGVFIYAGTRDPSAEELEEAFNTQLAYYWREYGVGRDIFAQRRRFDLVSPRQRDAARALLERGLIERPEWMDERAPKAERADFECEACGTTLKKNAKFCTTCHFVYDVKWVLDNRAKLPREIVMIAEQAEKVEKK